MLYTGERSHVFSGGGIDREKGECRVKEYCMPRVALAINVYNSFFDLATTSQLKRLDLFSECIEIPAIWTSHAH